MTTYREILLSEIPFWLYSSDKIHNAIVNNYFSITVDENIVIPENVNIKNRREFINMINCCNYFKYRYGSKEYPLSVYAYYFLNDLDKDDEKDAIKLPEIYRLGSLSEYCFENSIVTGSEKWDLIVQPKIEDISLVCDHQKITVFEKGKESLSIEISKYNQKIELLHIYYIFYDSLEKLFQEKECRISRILYMIENANSKQSYFEFFSEFFCPKRKNDKNNRCSSHVREYVKLVEIFLSLFELNIEIMNDLQKLSIKNHKRYFIKQIFSGVFRLEYNNQHKELFIDGIHKFLSFLDFCRDVSYYTPYEYYHSSYYSEFKIDFLYQSLINKDENREITEIFYVEENSIRYETPLFEKISDFCAS